MRQFFTINGILFVVFFFLSFLPHEGSFLGRSLFSISALSIIFFLPGWNTITLIAAILNKRFSLLEFTSLSMVTSFILPALLLVIEHQNFRIVSPELPLFNSVLIFLTTALFLKWNKREISPFHIPEKNIFLPDLKLLAASAFLYLSILGSIITAYYPLPDLDPYYWISQARDFFTRGSLPTLTESRPFFLSLTYLFSQGAAIDLYAYFKYVLPLLSTLLIFPAALIAQNLRHPLQKSVVFLFPFTSGIIIIFLAESIPQAIASILAFFITAIAIHAQYNRNTFLFFFVGAITLFGYFFHEALIIPLISWVLSLLFCFRKSILHLARKHSLVIFLLAIIILPYFAHIGQQLIFIAKALFNNLSHIHPNLLFPQEYINVDGNQMGWGDLFGVAKYYLFYVGPPLLFLLILLPIIKKASWKQHIQSPEGLFLFLSFGFFFLIAEILPRAIGMAFLPDRAWIFGGVFMLAFFPLFFETTLGKNKFILFLFLLGFSANIGAAIYINTLKKYVITHEQLLSAEWIQENLPKNRVIFTVESGRLLSFFSSSSVLNVKDPNFLFDESVFEKEFDARKNPFSEADQKKAIESLQSVIENFTTKNITPNIHEARKILEKIERIEKEKNEKEKLLHEERAYYIYYAAPNEKNPYLDRPYMKRIQNKEGEMIFNKHPEKFKRIYFNEKHQISLWKIL